MNDVSRYMQTKEMSLRDYVRPRLLALCTMFLRFSIAFAVAVAGLSRGVWAGGLEGVLPTLLVGQNRT